MSHHFNTMALHVTLAFIYAGLTVIQGVTTVEHVAIEAGRPVSVPCHYEWKYKDYVKYLCQGSPWSRCSYKIRTDQANSVKYNILDDRNARIVTFTFNNPQSRDSDVYWCIIEKSGTDDGQKFKLSVTRKDQSALHVHSQWTTGYIGSRVTIYCKFSGDGEKQWCRVGGTCIKTVGHIDGAEVSTKVSAPGEYAVTMSGLKTNNIGWYWCAFRDLQMPVFLDVTERPTTTTILATTRTTMSMESTTVKFIDRFGLKSVPDYLLGAFITLGLLMVIVIVSLVIWFMLKRQVKAEASFPQHSGDEPIYSNVIKRPTSHQNPCADKEMEILYSSVSFINNQTSNKVKGKEEDVVYSTVAHYQ